jgi:phage baseplate assembly protein W
VADAELERDAVRRRLLGWSVACDPLLPGVDHGRDLVLQGGNGEPLDLARVASMDCLGQSLEIAITTALGSDVFNTAFGFDGLNALVEETEPVLIRERVRIAVIQLLLKEPRIRQILDVNLGDERLRPGASATLAESAERASRTLDVSVSFETVSHDQASLNLGRVVPGG